VRSVLLALTLAACSGEPCEPRGEPSLTLGIGTGGVFEPFTDGQDVGLSVAPQGGFGVSVQASTTGLQTGWVELRVVSEQGGDVVGDFTIDAIRLYCQDDDTGLLWGAVVGFDPAIYRTNDDLLALDDERVTLVVTATDSEGTSVAGQVDVTLQVGE
jgi:hypothetical protein